MEKLADNYLMKKVRDGDLSKMGLLYERYNKNVYAYFYRCTANRAKSEDMVQNVFMRLIKYRKTFTGEGQFVYWLFATARNVWYDDHRKNDPLREKTDLESVIPAPDNANTPDQALEKLEQKKLLHSALTKLSPEKREAIVLSRFEGLKYSEIAVIANCTENAIKSRVQRGLIELKSLMQNVEYR